jgi:hypothetical protein
VINPISRNIVDTISIKENGVDAKPITQYVPSKDSVELNYDVDRYVRMLKNMVIPPQDRFDASILFELEMNGNITLEEVKNLIDEVEKSQNKL